MLAACGNATSIQVDPAYPDLLLKQSPQDTVIAKVDLNSKKIIDTGNTLPDILSTYFSPGGRMIYGLNWNFNGGDSTVQVYLFDPNTGALTDGSLITVPTQLENIFPARHP
jgi:hypothetical protein